MAAGVAVLTRILTREAYPQLVAIGDRLTAGCQQVIDEFGLDARSFAGLKVAAVGGVTAQALRDWGIQPDLVPEDEQSAKGLLDAYNESEKLKGRAGAVS